MLKNTPLPVLLLAGGIALVILGLALGLPPALSGLMIAAGAGLVGMSASSLCIRRLEKNAPASAQALPGAQRNARMQRIHQRAAAKAAGILQWALVVLAYLLILFNAPLWTVLTVIGLFLAYPIITVVLAARYQRQEP